MKNIVLIIVLTINALQFKEDSCNSNKYNKIPSAESSCNPKNEETKVLDVFGSDCTDLTFESIDLVSLETLHNVLIGEFNQLLVNFDKENIYISNVVQGETFRFNKKGKFINKIGKLGGGPKEISSFDDICFHGDTVDILNNMGDKVRVIGYKNDDTFLYSKSINLIAYSFEWMSPGYIFETSYRKGYPYRIYMTDVNGKITGTFLPNTTGFAMGQIENNFSRLGSKVYCKESYNNKVYIAEKSNLFPTYNIDLGSFAVPDEYFKSKPVQAFQLLLGHAFASIVNYFETPSDALFHIRQKPKSKSPNEDLIDYIFVLDKGTNKLMKRSFQMQSEDLFKYPVSGTLNNELIFLIYPYMIFNDQQTFNRLPINNPEIISRLKVDDNPVLAICKIKG
ncbi:6-bladed beta-propeller [Maribellus comscasis]|uniref:6-bladed beta-propeller n=1 Tax=Maribellus comscasis TaxID=2681766 RepID=A0A6I6K1M2_9BACT|nr:6-bladed beta-propeller [Maribellus comscasis]QGY47290.1 6-bladed beta-propeller [Maribellus comscasis]